MQELAAEGWEPVAGDAAIVVPEHFERVLPFTAPAFRQDIRDDLLQSYIAAREADLPVRLARERDGLPAGARLVLAPCAKLLTAPGIDRLRELATAGATVYLSYFAGSTPNQRGPWLAWLDELFGVRHGLRYGLVDPIDDDEVVFELVEDHGDLEAGTRLVFHAAGEASALGYLPVVAAGAEVVAVDGHGRPALLRHPLGAGSTVLCTYPLEHMAARTPRVNPEATWRIYSALASAAGVRRPIRVDDPRVLVGRLRAGRGERVLFVNCSADSIVAEPLAEEGYDLELSGPLPLDPFGVVVIQRDGAPHPVARGEGRDARV